MVLVPAGGVTFLSLNKKVTKEVSLERRLLIAPAMKAALSKNFPGALLRTSGVPGQIPRGATYYKNVSQSNNTETEGFPAAASRKSYEYNEKTMNPLRAYSIGSSFFKFFACNQIIDRNIKIFGHSHKQRQRGLALSIFVIGQRLPGDIQIHRHFLLV